jgi:hypothetical protein
VDAKVDEHAWAIAPMFAGFQCRIAAEEKLRYLAEHDDLTGLHNRRSLVAHLSDRFAAGRRGPVAVLYLDLDRLKSINDYFGHTAGDFYLPWQATKWRRCCPLAGYPRLSLSTTKPVTLHASWQRNDDRESVELYLLTLSDDRMCPCC